MSANKKPRSMLCTTDTLGPLGTHDKIEELLQQVAETTQKHLTTENQLDPFQRKISIVLEIDGNTVNITYMPSATHKESGKIISSSIQKHFLSAMTELEVEISMAVLESAGKF